MIHCHGHAGKRGRLAYERLNEDRKRYQFVTHEKIGKFVSFLYARVTTERSRERVQTVHMRTSYAQDTPEQAAQCRDAAIMYLTAGRCLNKNLSGMPCENWSSAKHTKPVCKFHELILDYNAAEDIYLAHDDYLARSSMMG